jgi:hypothetical protein
MTFPTPHARSVCTHHEAQIPPAVHLLTIGLCPLAAFLVPIPGLLHIQLPPSNIINIDLLVITRISIFVKLDIIIHTLVAISATPLASILPCLTEEMHTYQFR